VRIQVDFGQGGNLEHKRV